ALDADPRVLVADLPRQAGVVVVLALPARADVAAVRSEERRVGKGGVVGLAPGRRDERVGRADVVVVAERRRPRVAVVRPAGLRPVARVVVVALSVVETLLARVRLGVGERTASIVAIAVAVALDADPRVLVADLSGLAGVVVVLALPARADVAAV